MFLDAVDGVPEPLTIREAREFLDREINWLFRGAIFGFSYRYTPLDRSRGIEEEFLLEQLEVLKSDRC